MTTVLSIVCFVVFFWAGYETGKNVQLKKDLETIEQMKEEEIEK